MPDTTHTTRMIDEQAPDADALGLDATAQAKLHAALRERPFGLFTDIDGTISAIAPTPDAAVLLPQVSELLALARDTFNVVAAVSGRAAADAFRLVGLRGLMYIGNHGLERWEFAGQRGSWETLHKSTAPGVEPAVEAIHETLEVIAHTVAPRFPGLLIEPKGVTASIHVRQTGDPAAAERAVLNAIEQSKAARALRVTQGKMVIELRPPVRIDKGVAVSEVIRQRDLRGAIYIGDDRTDIDAFRTLRRLTAEGACQGVAVAVLQEDSPPELAAEADVTLDAITRVPNLLRWLIANGSSAQPV